MSCKKYIYIYIIAEIIWQVESYFMKHFISIMCSVNTCFFFCFTVYMWNILLCTLSLHFQKSFTITDIYIRIFLFFFLMHVQYLHTFLGSLLIHIQKRVSSVCMEGMPDKVDFQLTTSWVASKYYILTTAEQMSISRNKTQFLNYPIHSVYVSYGT